MALYFGTTLSRLSVKNQNDKFFEWASSALPTSYPSAIQQKLLFDSQPQLPLWVHCTGLWLKLVPSLPLSLTVTNRWSCLGLENDLGISTYIYYLWSTALNLIFICSTKTLGHFCLSSMSPSPKLPKLADLYLWTKERLNKFLIKVFFVLDRMYVIWKYSEFENLGSWNCGMLYPRTSGFRSFDFLRYGDILHFKMYRELSAFDI